MTRRLVIYGATGFTGRLIVDEALARGIEPLVAGRSAQKVRELARAFGVEGRAARVDDAEALRALVGPGDVLLNAAGPFVETAAPLARACIARGAHYLDVSGELASLRQLLELDGAARQAQVMLLPAAGYDVVPSDCLAARLIHEQPSTRELVFAFTGLNTISRGSAASVVEQFDELVMVRRQGQLTRVPPGSLEQKFDFGAGPVSATAITWGDVVTAYHSTGVRDITVYYEQTPLVRAGITLARYWGGWMGLASAKAPMKSAVQLLPEGPSPLERARGEARLIVRAIDADGGVLEARLRTPEVYSFTAMTSLTVAERALCGEIAAGFQTPSRAYGFELIRGIPGVRLEEPSRS